MRRVFALAVGLWASIVGAALVHRGGSGRFWNLAEPETVLIPEEFEGALTIVYRSTLGHSAPREGDARVYDFRDRRVLRLSEIPPGGYRNQIDYFLVDARGRRRLLARGDRCREGPSESGIYVCSEVVRGLDPGLIRAETFVVTRDPRMIVAGRLSGDTIAERGRILRPEDLRPVEMNPPLPRR
jgi:hypothetical protein